MYKIFDKKNIIPDEIADKIYSFMIDNYCNREEYKNRPRGDFDSKEKHDQWLNMLRTFDDYYTLVYYQDDIPVGFVSYNIIDRGLCLCEIQIKENYQGKYDILRKMLKATIAESSNYKYDNIVGGISNNKHSVDVFTHIGMVNTEKSIYEISLNDLLKWLNK